MNDYGWAAEQTSADPPLREAETKFWWLIERGQPEGFDPPIYFGLEGSQFGGHWPRWTRDAYEAQRFDSEPAALSFMESMRDGERPMPGRPVQHGFIEESRR